MNNYFEQLKVLRNLENNKLICSLLAFGAEKTQAAHTNLLYEIYASGAEESLLTAVQSAVLHDENAFSVTCAGGGRISDFLKEAFIDDIEIIFNAVNELDGGKSFYLGEPLPQFESNDTALTVKRLENFYRKHGYGQFIDGKAFGYSDGQFTPLNGTADITLSQLKNYESEKTLIETNVKNFLENLPFSHMLLYGDRGTGKSSTVHAMLNAYCDKGLRLVELDKNDLPSIKKIKQQLAPLPLKFIIFIDDLTLDEQDERTSALKSAVEGSVVYGNNVMIVATSNRRHVVKESFSERDNSVHPADSIEEQLSLSDRFGLTVMFSSTDKASYLSIVRQLAADCNLGTATEQLETLAERWAIQNGGRSPRRAKQFVDFIYACERSGRAIDF